jgi:hypothetical protein
MGFGIVDANEKYAGAWSRWDNPPRPLLPGESVVECEWDAENDRPVGLTMPEPVVEIPVEVSPAQIRIWLISQGIALSQVDGFIDAIEDTTQREIARVKWEYGLVVRRNDPLVVAFAAALGMTSEEMDAAFLTASEL